MMMVTRLSVEYRLVPSLPNLCDVWSGWDPRTVSEPN